LPGKFNEQSSLPASLFPKGFAGSIPAPGVYYFCMLKNLADFWHTRKLRFLSVYDETPKTLKTNVSLYFKRWWIDKRLSLVLKENG